MMKLIQRFKRLPYLVQHLYEKITTSIAFLPMLISVGFFIVTVIIMYFEQKGLTGKAGEVLPSYLLIKSWDVAQSILTTLVGALISLMVFSFSMVMVLLNNAAANYSPRILPGLIDDKFHQMVLGFYLGTITYCLLLVINMTPSQPDIPLPGFGVLVAIVFGLTSLMLFVFFIHSISESVQVSKILEELHYSTLYNMKHYCISEFTDEALPEGSEEWQPYDSDRSGYLKKVNTQMLQKLCVASDMKVKVHVAESRFVVEGLELFSCNRAIDEDMKNEILNAFVFSNHMKARGDHIVGFKQITEIAVKAMSPGINDPGTALTAIDYLTILFMEKMKLGETGAVRALESDEGNGVVCLWLHIIGFEELLMFVMAPLRQYARHDMIVVLKLMQLLKFMMTRGKCSDLQRRVIMSEVEALMTDAEYQLKNAGDYEKVKRLGESILEG